jgi:hypothetical protein
VNVMPLSGLEDAAAVKGALDQILASIPLKSDAPANGWDYPYIA